MKNVKYGNTIKALSDILPFFFIKNILAGKYLAFKKCFHITKTLSTLLPLAQGSRSIKNLLIFGHCRNCLDPPTPLFSWTYTKHFFLSQKISGKMYIMSKLWQKSASKVLGLVSNSPPPLENVQIQGEKVPLTIWIWIGPPPPIS